MRHPGNDAASALRRRRARPLIWLLEIVGAGIGALAAILVAVVAWMQVAPLEFGFLAPHLVAWLDNRLAPYRVEMTSATLRWHAGRGAFLIEENGFRLLSPSGMVIARAPALAVTIGVRPLFEGRLVASHIAARSPFAAVYRRADGTLSWDARGEYPVGVPGERGATAPIVAVADALSGAPSWRSQSQALRTVDISDGDLEVTDEASGTVWRADGIGANFSRAVPGITAAGTAQIHAGAAVATARLRLEYKGGGQLSYVAGLDAIDPGSWTAVAPALRSVIGAVRLPLSVTADGMLDLARGLTPGAGRFEVSGGPGSLAATDFADGALRIERLSGAGRFDAAATTLDIDRAAVDLYGPNLQMTAHLGPQPAVPPGGAASFAVQIDARLRAVPGPLIRALWPLDFAPGGRGWVAANLAGGSLDDADAHVAGAWQPGAAGGLRVTSAQGRLQLSHFSVRFLDGLPPVENVGADAKFTTQHIDFTFHGGRLAGVAVQGGDAAINGLDGTEQNIALSLDLAGPARDIVALLAADRLKIAQRAGLTADRTSGSVTGTVRFRFPLVKTLGWDDIHYEAAAQLNDFMLRNAAFGSDLTQGSFTAKLSPTLFTASGKGLLGGVPAQIDWRQRVGGNAPERAGAHLRCTADDAQRRRLGFDLLTDYVHGPVAVDADYSEAAAGGSRAVVSLGLDGAQIDLDLAGWHKAPGPPAQARFIAGFEGGVLRQIDSLQVEAPSLSITGTLAFDPGDRIRQANFPALRVGDTNLALAVEHRDGGWEIRATGAAMDARPILKKLRSASENSDESGPRYHLAVATDRIALTQGTLNGARLDAVQDRGRLVSMALHAGLDKVHRFEFDLAPQSEGGDFSLTSDDFGTVLKAFDVTDQVRGGHFEISGDNRQVDGHRVFRGHVTGGDYSIVDAPVMTRLLSLASLTTVSSLLAGEGIPFSTLKADIGLEEGRITISNARTHGSALGITLEGWLDLDRNTLDMTGTLVPAYLLNSTLGAVPLVGNLLLGGKGQGLFAANFRLSGSLDNVDTMINPLSVLAPGALRELFPFGLGAPSAPPPPGATK